MRYPKHLSSLIKASIGSAVCLLMMCSVDTGDARADEIDRWLVPRNIREAVLNEFSGELALRHVEILSVDRDRQPEEYLGRFMETEYVADLAEQYGLSDVRIDLFPSGEVWDAEEAELWLLEPVKKKIAGLEIVPEALAAGSRDADVTAEVVYVGRGEDQDFKGKSVRGKIVLGSGSVSQVFRTGVTGRKAAGALGTGSSGTVRGYPNVSPDQIGWQSVRPGKDENGFGFILSRRQFDEIRGYLEVGEKVLMRAKVRTRMYPNKLNVVSAAVPGTDPGAPGLLMVAHLFERIGTPGANDNCSGVATILEVGRTLTKLIEKDILPRPRRTIRFLWVPEIRGTREFMYANPELEDRLLAALNFDMTGANLKTTDAYLRMKKTPDSCPSYLNDLLADLLLCVDQTIIRTQWSPNSQFNYRLCPFISGSDHTIFLAAGIPTMQFNYYGDNFYHSSEDRSMHVDPTEMKRVGFVAASAFYYLAAAGPGEARDLAWEASAGGEKWLAEVSRQNIRLLQNKGLSVHAGYAAARNKIDGAFLRARGSLESVLEISDSAEVAAFLKPLTGALEISRDNHVSRLDILYREMCKVLDQEPQQMARSAEEEDYARMVPRKLFKLYSEDYKTRSGDIDRNIPKNSPRLPSLARFEVPNFIDGKRSLLEIYQAVRAEYAFVETGNDEAKYAYIISPGSPDIPLSSVVDYVLAMEKAGLVEILEKTQP